MYLVKMKFDHNFNIINSSKVPFNVLAENGRCIVLNNATFTTLSKLEDDFYDKINKVYIDDNSSLDLSLQENIGAYSLRYYCEDSTVDLAFDDCKKALKIYINNKYNLADLVREKLEDLI
jgi:hypothetical protein